MLFKPELQRAIVEVRKTQTRRLVKPGDTLDKGVVCHNGRRKWRTGQDYSVQYGRGKPTCLWFPIQRAVVPYEQYDSVKESPMSMLLEMPRLLRIRITRIRCEDVRDISEADALAEGFGDIESFWATWISMYDKLAERGYRPATDPVEMLRNYLQTRPDEFYQAWVLDFEVVT